MKYFKALTDNVTDKKTGYFTVKNELITASERERNYPTLSDANFTQVEVSQKNVYFFFGARFENGTSF